MWPFHLQQKHLLMINYSSEFCTLGPIHLLHPEMCCAFLHLKFYILTSRWAAWLVTQGTVLNTKKMQWQTFVTSAQREIITVKNRQGINFRWVTDSISTNLQEQKMFYHCRFLGENLGLGGNPISVLRMILPALANRTNQSTQQSQKAETSLTAGFRSSL